MTVLKTTPIAILVALGMMVTPAAAQTASEATTVTVEQAIAIALEAQPGTIGEAELDRFDGVPAFDIEVVDASGNEIEFKIDAETGEILNVWTDDDPSDDPADGTDADG